MEGNSETNEPGATLSSLFGVQPAVIEVVSDVVCPWCFIGKRRLEKALALLDRDNVRVHWRAFQLNPDAPKLGMDRCIHRVNKFGSLARADQLEAQVVAAGAEAGINFHFGRIGRIPNTFNAHRLIWLAGREGVQDAVVEILFGAYFIHGEDIGRPEILKRIGLECGLHAAKVEELFTTDLGAKEVLGEERQAQALGVNTVPTFLFEGAPVISGAEKPELLAAALRPAMGPASGLCSNELGLCG